MEKGSNMTKRLISMLLAVVMVFSMLPAGIIERNGRYDQLIRYMDGNGRVRFVHVSWKRCGVNRRMKLRA